MAMTNYSFAEAVGINYTMASRLRNGKRLPSGRLLLRIQEQFGLPYEELRDAYQGGSAEFGRYISAKIFDAPDEVAS